MITDWKSSTQWDEYRMDWPLDKDWVCEICGKRNLMWGFIHAQCRCAICHTQYRMRDGGGNVVRKPIIYLKPEYYEVIKLIWDETKTRCSDLTSELLDEYMDRAREGQNG